MAVDVSEAPADGIKLVIYGDNRTGKTSLAATFPKPLLFVSVEPARSGGLDSITKVPGVKALVLGTHFNTFAESVRIGEELFVNNSCGYRTVVLDSATSYEKLALDSIMADAGRVLPEQQSYGLVSGEQYQDRSSRAKTGMAWFLGLSCNVVVTAKEKDHNPPREVKINSKTGKEQPDMRAKWLRGMGAESKYGPAVGSATAGWMNDASASVCRMYWAPEVRVEETVSEIAGEKVVTRTEYETGEYVLRMRLKQHPNYMGGLRANDHSKVPTYLDDPTYDKLLAVLRASS